MSLSTSVLGLGGMKTMGEATMALSWSKDAHDMKFIIVWNYEFVGSCAIKLLQSWILITWIGNEVVIRIKYSIIYSHSQEKKRTY